METIYEENHSLFKEAWKKYEPGIRKLCLVKMQSIPDEIEDVVSDVFLFFWKEIQENGPPKCIQAWLYKVAYNQINRRYYNNNRKVRYTEPYDDTVVVVGYDIDDARFESETLFQWADEIIENLPQEDKLLMKYIYEDGLSMREIAAKMDSTEAAVKQRHYRLTRKIKRVVKERIEQG